MKNKFNTVLIVLLIPFQNIYAAKAEFTPQEIAAILVFFIGAVILSSLSYIVQRLNQGRDLFNRMIVNMCGLILAIVVCVGIVYLLMLVFDLPISW